MSLKKPQNHKPDAQATVSFITLGCAKNEVDSDKMRARLRAAGWAESSDPASADVVVVNTCSFITEATEEAISTILEVLDLPSFAERRAKLVVAGCLPARYGTTLEVELPEVSAFVTCADEDNIAEILKSLVEDDRKLPLAMSSSPTPLRTITAPWAYVKIADGCDRRCSFCTIPTIRGHYRSVPSDEIFAEVAELTSSGVREIILIAQDTGLWSQKIEPGNLASLLDALALRFSETWFRVMYLQPQGISDELLSVMAAHDNICNYLDIPLQHASQRVLHEMNRRGSGEEYLDLLARIRAAIPDVALRTTVIAGFPGETRAEAKELEHFLEAAAFDYVGVFPYSPEEGTPAGLRNDQVNPRTRRARAQRIRDLADALSFEKVAARIGSTHEVLITDREEDEDVEAGEGQAGETRTSSQISVSLLGRTQYQAPEVDGMIHLDRGRIGDIVSATMTEAYCYELDAQVAGVMDA